MTQTPILGHSQSCNSGEFAVLIKEDEMRKARFSEEQITYALKLVESGRPVGEVCRQLWVSKLSFYRWKRRFEGIGVAELRQLRQLEDENRKPKKIVADLPLD